MIDFEANAPLPGDDSLRRVAGLVASLGTLEEHLAQAEKHVATLKASLLQLTTQTLPAVMKEIGVTEFATLDGRKLTLKPGLEASISAERKPAAFAWLRANGHGDLIKNYVEVQTGRGKDAEVDALLRWCDEHQLAAQRDESVHSGTLKAFVRERFTQAAEEGSGAVPPDDLFGIFRYEKAEWAKGKKKA